MKNLLEIFQIILRGNPEKIELLDKALLRKGNSKFAQFYKGLASGKIKSDLEAAQLIYNTSATDPKYRQLKSRFRKRLFNTLFLLDATDLINREGEEGKSLFIQLQKQWSLTLIAHQYKAKKAAIGMARNLLLLCDKYKFHQLACEVSYFLWKNAMLSRDVKNAKAYEEQLKKHRAFYQAQKEAEENFYRIVFKLKQQEKDPDIPFDCQQEAQRLIQLADQYPSAEVYFYMFHTWALHYRQRGNYRAMAQICRQAQTQFENFPHWPESEELQSFAVQEMYAYWALKDFKAAAQLAKNKEEDLKTNFPHWLEFMELYFLTAMYVRNYTQALLIYNKTGEHTFLHEHEIDPDTKVKWQIFRAYLYLLKDCGLLKQAIAHRRMNIKDASHARWNKEVKKQWKLIFLLTDLIENQRPVDDAVFRANQGLKTKSKQPNNPTAVRRAIFLKLLERLHKANYKKDQLRLTDKYYTQLRSLQPQASTDLSKLEVIPYEHLWEIILERFNITTW